MVPQKIFKIRIFNLAENEFQTTKFPDFFEFCRKFPDYSRFSRSVATLEQVMNLSDLTNTCPYFV